MVGGSYFEWTIGQKVCPHCKTTDWFSRHSLEWREGDYPGGEFYVTCRCCKGEILIHYQKIPAYWQDWAVKRAKKPSLWKRIFG